MKTEITALLGTEYPIIQGGMAWVAEHHLAAAVSEAGGLGIIGAANAPADWVREQIHKVRELTKRFQFAKGGSKESGKPKFFHWFFRLFRRIEVTNQQFIHGSNRIFS